MRAASISSIAHANTELTVYIRIMYRAARSRHWQNCNKPHAIRCFEMMHNAYSETDTHIQNMQHDPGTNGLIHCQFLCIFTAWQKGIRAAGPKQATRQTKTKTIGYGQKHRAVHTHTHTHSAQYITFQIPFVRLILLILHWSNSRQRITKKTESAFSKEGNWPEKWMAVTLV